MKALVVSEEQNRRHWVAQALGPAWEIDEASDGREALRTAMEGDHDLVITDETAQPFGGFGLSRELKVLIDPPAVMVLLERPQDQWLARWSGADRWLVMPVDPFTLADAAASIAAPSAATRRKT